MPKNIIVTVKTAYIPTQSDPENSQFVFAYTITIHNNGTEGAKLLTRHWIITDAHGNTQEVKGEGVLGQQPHLAPGETYEYTSGTILNTPVGCMKGSYQMISDTGEAFDAEIPLFSLAIPDILH